MLSPLKKTRQATDIRRASLVHAALKLASLRSPSAVTTSDLAQAVGITQGAVFRHFASKDAIWLAVLDWATDALMTELKNAAASHESGNDSNHLAALEAVFLAHVKFVVSHPALPRIIFQELQHSQDTPLKARVAELMQQYRQLVAGLLKQAQAQGLLAPKTDLQAAAALFLGSVQGLVMQSMLNGQVDAMATGAPDVFAIYLRGLISKEAS